MPLNISHAKLLPVVLACHVFMLRAIGLCALALFCIHAFALPGEAPTVTSTSTGGVVTGGKLLSQSPSDFQRLISKTAGTGTGITWTDAATVKAGQTEFQALLQRKASKAAIASASASVLKNLPVVGLGLTIWDIYDGFRVRPDGSGGLVEDPGTPPTLQTITQYRCNTGSNWNTYTYSSSVAACQAFKVANDPPGFKGNFQCSSDGQYKPYSTSYTNFRMRTTGALTGPVDFDTTVSFACPGFGGTTTSSAGDGQAQTTEATQCPASVGMTDTIPAGAPVGPDGKCRTGTYGTPISIIAAGLKWSQYVPEAKIEPTARDTLDRGGEIVPDVAPIPGTLSGPSSVQQPGTTVTNTPSGGGQPVTTTIPGATTNITYNDNKWTITTTTTTTNPDGSTTTTTKPPEVKTCGLPDTPPCKIDETGTPSDMAAADAAAAQKKDDAFKEITKAVTDPTTFFPAFPTLSFSFALPTGCSAIPAGAFAPYFTSIDICPFQPMFHDIMGVVWTIGCALAALNMFFRDSMAS